MSLIDTLKGSLGQAGAAALPSVIQAVFPGGLQGLLDRLQTSGYGQQVGSWLGRGPNQPITVEDLRGVLANTQVQAMAQRFGIPLDALLPYLSEHLPEAVDRQSPDGTLKTPPAA